MIINSPEKNPRHEDGNGHCWNCFREVGVLEAFCRAVEADCVTVFFCSTKNGSPLEKHISWDWWRTGVVRLEWVCYQWLTDQNSSLMVKRVKKPFSGCFSTQARLVQVYLSGWRWHSAYMWQTLMPNYDKSLGFKLQEVDWVYLQFSYTLPISQGVCGGINLKWHLKGHSKTKATHKSVVIQVAPVEVQLAPILPLYNPATIIKSI